MMIRRRNKYFRLFLSVIIIFLYIFLFLFAMIRYELSTILLRKIMNLVTNREVAEALFVVIFVLIPISFIYAIINRKPR